MATRGEGVARDAAAAAAGRLARPKCEAIQRHTGQVLTEIHRDALYVSEEYIEGYGEGTKNARRPETKEAVIAAWRGLACECSDGKKIVGALPTVKHGGSVKCAPCGVPTRVSVHAESERGT